MLAPVAVTIATVAIVIDLFQELTTAPKQNLQLRRSLSLSLSLSAALSQFKSVYKRKVLSRKRETCSDIPTERSCQPMPLRGMLPLITVGVQLMAAVGWQSQVDGAPVQASAVSLVCNASRMQGT